MKNQGFVLIELIIIIGIMGIIMAMAAPLMNNSLANYQLHTACMQLQQHIRSVAQEALVKDCDDYRIVLYMETDKYKITAPLDNGGPIMIMLPDEVDLVFSNFKDNNIIFSGKGKPTVGGHIRLQSKKTGQMKYVIVAAITGRTRISDTPPAYNDAY